MRYPGKRLERLCLSLGTFMTDRIPSSTFRKAQRRKTTLLDDLDLFSGNQGR